MQNRIYRDADMAAANVRLLDFLVKHPDAFMAKEWAKGAESSTFTLYQRLHGWVESDVIKRDRAPLSVGRPRILYSAGHNILAEIQKNAKTLDKLDFYKKAKKTIRDMKPLIAAYASGAPTDSHRPEDDTVIKTGIGIEESRLIAAYVRAGMTPERTALPNTDMTPQSGEIQDPAQAAHESIVSKLQNALSDVSATIETLPEGKSKDEWTGIRYQLHQVLDAALKQKRKDETRIRAALKQKALQIAEADNTA
ncbi:MAG: hypothetical protein ABSB53_05160 [Nitrososphaerales archaeon]|jgi:predicted transcriptional regulator